MKKRILSLFLLAALVVTALPLHAGAVSPRLPIYVGNPAVDYMANEILKEIPTEGLDSYQQIQAVYDWIIANCARTGTPDKTYFDPKEVAAQSKGAFAAKTAALLEHGQVLLRQELKPISGTPASPDDYIDFDSNQNVAQYAYEMMLNRIGNCAHFSSLLTVLLGHLGYDSHVIHGEFINMDGSIVEHTWNYILVDGTYLWADIRIDHAVGGHNYFLKEDTDAWAKEHNWDHGFSDWLKANEAKIAHEFSLAVDAALGPWGMCSDWAKKYMQTAGQIGLIPARLDYQDLTANITRAEFAAISVRLYEVLKQPVPPYQGESPFSDTSDPDVLRAYNLGVVNGMEDGTFAPDASLTREQAVTMLGRVYELAMTNAVSGGSALPQGTEHFTDHDSIFEYARAYVYFFAGQNILSGMGDGTFSPKLPMTREQAIKVAVETATKLA